MTAQRMRAWHGHKPGRALSGGKPNDIALLVCGVALLAAPHTPMLDSNIMFRLLTSAVPVAASFFLYAHVGATVRLSVACTAAMTLCLGLLPFFVPPGTTAALPLGALVGICKTPLLLSWVAEFSASSMTGERHTPYRTSISKLRTLGLLATTCAVSFLFELSSFCLAVDTRGTASIATHVSATVLHAAMYALLLLYAKRSPSNGTPALYTLSAIGFGQILWDAMPNHAALSIHSAVDGLLAMVYITLCLFITLLLIWAQTKKRTRSAIVFAASRPHIQQFQQGKQAQLLSNRERQIAVLLLDGLTQKEIAKLLAISPASVATYYQRMFKKMHVTSKSEFIQACSPRTGSEQAAEEEVRKAIARIAEGELDHTSTTAHVLMRIVEGKTARQIASELYISPSTVSKHRKKGYRALGVSNKRELLHIVSEELSELQGTLTAWRRRRLRLGL